MNNDKNSDRKMPDLVTDPEGVVKAIHRRRESLVFEKALRAELEKDGWNTSGLGEPSETERLVAKRTQRKTHSAYGTTLRTLLDKDEPAATAKEPDPRKTGPGRLGF